MQDNLQAILALADDHLILGQRTAELTGSGPSLEEELASANHGLDFIGQARALYALVAEEEGRGRTEDDLAFLRLEHEYRNLLLVEQPNEDFAHVQVRLLFFSAFMAPYWHRAKASSHPQLAGIAGQAEKESIHHRRHAAEWCIRLGDGTDESRDRMEDAVEELWTFCGELFEVDASTRAAVAAGILPDRQALRDEWLATIDEVLRRATMSRPEVPMHQTGGRGGRHTEYLGHLLANLQYMQRAYPGATW